jgi:hypothetical protein
LPCVAGVCPAGEKSSPFHLCPSDLNPMARIRRFYRIGTSQLGTATLQAQSAPSQFESNPIQIRISNHRICHELVNCMEIVLLYKKLQI